MPALILLIYHPCTNSVGDRSYIHRCKDTSCAAIAPAGVPHGILETRLYRAQIMARPGLAGSPPGVTSIIDTAMDNGRLHYNQCNPIQPHTTPYNPTQYNPIDHRKGQHSFPGWSPLHAHHWAGTGTSACARGGAADAVAHWQPRSALAPTGPKTCVSHAENMPMAAARDAARGWPAPVHGGVDCIRFVLPCAGHARRRAGEPGPCHEMAATHALRVLCRPGGPSKEAFFCFLRVHRNHTCSPIDRVGRRSSAQSGRESSRSTPATGASGRRKPSRPIHSVCAGQGAVPGRAGQRAAHPWASGVVVGVRQALHWQRHWFDSSTDSQQPSGHAWHAIDQNLKGG
jgi:hypothetical protein